MTTYQLDGGMRKASNKASMSIVFLLTQKKMIGYLEEDFSVRQCLEKMRYHGYTAMPVLSKTGEYIGTVNEGDFLWCLVDHDDFNLHDYEQVQLMDIIRTDWNRPIKVTETVDDVIMRMFDQNFLPVVDDRDKFMGIITRKSVLQYMSESSLHTASV
ncbi:hypothetical protein AOC36_07020 [Erysipelothrix larvae]|uniref:CBS domain-containing protein n=1 Tax=Erysipelothrix larvae TaxID=1514105 RepID=A0A0X8H0C7_9FIRM|nr:CBS domain-containing protein [Erysipelothrix larvae]AMC93743.1 hypothetical protein AOC36_07020 [Erysipelothrix larvae]